MNTKYFIRLILLLTILVSSFAVTNQAFAASACGLSTVVVRNDTLRIIAARCDTTVYALRRANPEINSNDVIYPGQVLLLPGAFITNANGQQIYIVARGDMLKSLAARFNTSMDVLIRQNPEIYNANWIYEGQRLVVSGTSNPAPQPPPAAVSSYTIQANDTLRIIAARFDVTVDDLLRANPQITNPNRIYVGQVISIPDAASSYVVQRGDTLRIIASRFGTTVANILALNPSITNPNWIYPGQVIRLR